MIKVWYFSCHGICQARAIDKSEEEALTEVMVGFGPVSMNQTARAHLTLCTGDHTPTHIRTVHTLDHYTVVG